MNQELAKLEGLAIGLEQRGEKSAAHQVRWAVREITLAADLITAATNLLDWAREHTSPRDVNTPHALLVTLAAALTAITARTGRGA